MKRTKNWGRGETFPYGTLKFCKSFFVSIFLLKSALNDNKVEGASSEAKLSKGWKKKAGKNPLQRWLLHYPAVDVLFMRCCKKTALIYPRRQKLLLHFTSAHVLKYFLGILIIFKDGELCGKKCPLIRLIFFREHLNLSYCAVLQNIRVFCMHFYVAGGWVTYADSVGR